jgi:hypothetical protein
MILGEIMPKRFERIILCADAILAKEEGLWYFYDFWGNKIHNKGYRKILPLKTNHPPEKSMYDKHIYTTKGIITYSVLDGNEIKQISNLYEGHKTDFVNGWAQFLVCGAIMGPHKSSRIKFYIKNNSIEMERITHWYDSDIFKDADNHAVILKNSVSFNPNKDKKVQFLNKKDSTNSFVSHEQDERFTYIFKAVKNNKESFLPICFGYDLQKNNLFFYEIRCMEKEFEFDKIEEQETRDEIPLLNSQGDYGGVFGIFETKSNLYPNTYYKLYKDGKVGFYSPRFSRLKSVEIKYKSLGDFENRFLRFENEDGKKGLLSEDGEEFFLN